MFDFANVCVFFYTTKTMDNISDGLLSMSLALISGHTEIASKLLNNRVVNRASYVILPYPSLKVPSDVPKDISLDRISLRVIARKIPSWLLMYNDDPLSIMFLYQKDKNLLIPVIEPFLPLNWTLFHDILSKRNLRYFSYGGLVNYFPQKYVKDSHDQALKLIGDGKDNFLKIGNKVKAYVAEQSLFWKKAYTAMVVLCQTSDYKELGYSMYVKGNRMFEPNAETFIDFKFPSVVKSIYNSQHLNTIGYADSRNKVLVTFLRDLIKNKNYRITDVREVLTKNTNVGLYWELYAWHIGVLFPATERYFDPSSSQELAHSLFYLGLKKDRKSLNILRTNQILITFCFNLNFPVEEFNRKHLFRLIINPKKECSYWRSRYPPNKQVLRAFKKVGKNVPYATITKTTIIQIIGSKVYDAIQHLNMSIAADTEDGVGSVVSSVYDSVDFTLSKSLQEFTQACNQSTKLQRTSRELFDMICRGFVVGGSNVLVDGTRLGRASLVVEGKICQSSNYIDAVWTLVHQCMLNYSDLKDSVQEVLGSEQVPADIRNISFSDLEWVKWLSKHAKSYNLSNSSEKKITPEGFMYTLYILLLAMLYKDRVICEDISAYRAFVEMGWPSKMVDFSNHVSFFQFVGNSNKIILFGNHLTKSVYYYFFKLMTDPKTVLDTFEVEDDHKTLENFLSTRTMWLSYLQGGSEDWADKYLNMVQYESYVHSNQDILNLKTDMLKIDPEKNVADISVFKTLFAGMAPLKVPKLIDTQQWGGLKAPLDGTIDNLFKFFTQIRSDLRSKMVTYINLDEIPSMELRERIKSQFSPVAINISSDNILEVSIKDIPDQYLIFDICNNHYSPVLRRTKRGADKRPAQTQPVQPVAKINKEGLGATYYAVYGAAVGAIAGAITIQCSK